MVQVYHVNVVGGVPPSGIATPFVAMYAPFGGSAPTRRIHADKRRGWRRLRFVESAPAKPLPAGVFSTLRFSPATLADRLNLYFQLEPPPRPIRSQGRDSTLPRQRQTGTISQRKPFRLRRRNQRRCHHRLLG